ncbi:hypothetical protein B5M42_000910 [Paenibacillus athensensis]|uniref:Uncharacterized protein n=1 Tax=Paenibacillus athensensis TaxID=1967502 RepID=A0A4Y8Q7S0_9BACL|nr:hypothetical protein [Paenibacillus athensensis]MCD1257395.1 hypothetical protein [Paenibacillus athensensis]
MNAQAYAEKEAIMRDLDNVVRELQQMAAELQRIKGIGAEICAGKLLRLADKYSGIRSQLQYRV